jgi:hypothetical protein
VSNALLFGLWLMEMGTYGFGAAYLLAGFNRTENRFEEIHIFTKIQKSITKKSS